MRIGIDARPLSVPKTGIGQYLREILKVLSVIDSENEYLLYSNRPINLDFPGSDRFHTRIDRGGIGTIWLHTRLPRLLRKDRIALFWGPDYAIPMFPQRMAKVLVIHDLTYRYFPETLPRQIVMHLKYCLPFYVKRADLIITDSYSAKSGIIKELKVSENKIKVVHLAAGCKENNMVNQDGILNKFGIEKPDYILFVGTIEPRKNVEGIIRCYAKLKEKMINPPRLVIAGGWGWKSENVKRLVTELKLLEKVIFTGYVSDDELAVLYRNAGVLLYPSFYEGFGLPPLEAMSYGIPVICSNTSSLPEVVGDAAIMINPYDIDDMFSALRKVYTDKELRKIYIKKSIQQSKKFSWEKTAQHHLTVFEIALYLKK